MYHHTVTLSLFSCTEWRQYRILSSKNCI